MDIKIIILIASLLTNVVLGILLAIERSENRKNNKELKLWRILH